MSSRFQLPIHVEEALAEIRLLLYVSQQTRSMAKTWSNAEKRSGRDVRKAEAGPLALRVMKRSRIEALSLLETVFGGAPPEALKEVRAQSVQSLRKALRAAEALAEAENEGFPELAGRGTFNLSVAKPLRELIAARTTAAPPARKRRPRQVS